MRRILSAIVAVLVLAGSSTAQTPASVPAASAGVEPPRPLTARGQRNLEAFARIYGYVRWFHPSDEAAAADWDALAVSGVQRVEAARDDKELAAQLRAVFLPLAPTLVIEPGAPPAPAISTVPTTDQIAWTHEGLQFDPMNTYVSRRGPPRPGLAPDAEARLDLGGGLNIRMRLVLPASGAPQARGPALAPIKPAGFAYTGDDRATRLADVVIAWNIFQHFYPYFDVAGTDWPAELSRGLMAAAVDKDGVAFESTLQTLVAALQDGHGRANSVRKTRLLPIFWDWVEDQLVITEVAPEGAQGLEVGDVVLTLDGRPVKEAITEEARLISSATPQWRQRRALWALSDGEIGTSATLDVRKADGTSVEVTLPHSLYGPTAPHLTEIRPAPIAELKPGLLYVDLERASGDMLMAAEGRLLSAKAIIFDVRGYPNSGFFWLAPHLSDRTLFSASFLTPIITRPDRQDWSWRADSRWEIPPEAPLITARKVFLTDGRAISFAESVMSVVEGQRLGDIVGGPTAGTNGNANRFTLPGDYRLIFTGMKVTKQDGSRHHGVGIQPTIPVERTLAGVQTGRDELLEAAVKAAGF